ncbi:MAG: NADH-quinone oxidoreductase subunit, partial [Burkholderia sp.]|nr:NADH-quinone oxidoreductase subunit [Burkholderia sp.]
MNQVVIPIINQGATRQRKREAPKGRRVDPEALAEVRALLGDAPRRPDLLIEHLHLIQDQYRCLSTAHLAALAQELRLAQAEVYEVASFYHHFEVVREGGAVPAALTVRVCDGIACELAGAGQLLQRLPAILGADVRVIHAPCVGRCEQAPVAVVGQKAIPKATVETVQQTVAAGIVTDIPEAGYRDLAGYIAEGGYALLRQCASGETQVEAVIAAMESSGLRGLGGAGFP